MAGMILVTAPEGKSEALRHAVELTNCDLDGLLDGLSTTEQNQFWSNLHGYALAEKQGRGRSAHLRGAGG